MKKLKYLIAAAGIAGILLTAHYPIHEGLQYVKVYHEKNKTAKESSKIVMNIQTLQQMEDLVKNNEKVAVDISATWCGPCREYDPVFEEVMEEYKDKTLFCKILLDKINNKEEKKIIEKYNVRYIPKTIFFKKGKEAYSQFGSMDKKTLIGLVETYLLEKNKN